MWCLLQWKIPFVGDTVLFFIDHFLRSEAPSSGHWGLPAVCLSGNCSPPGTGWPEVKPVEQLPVSGWLRDTNPCFTWGASAGSPSSRPLLEGTWGFQSNYMEGLLFVLPDPAFLLSLQVYFQEHCSSSLGLSVSKSVLRKPTAEHTLINLHFNGVILQNEVKKKSLYFG